MQAKIKYYTGLLFIMLISLKSLISNADKILQRWNFEGEKIQWKHSCSNGLQANHYAVWDKKEAHSGNKALKLFFPEFFGKTIRWHSPVFQCMGNLKICFWLKTKSLVFSEQKGHIIVRIVFFDISHKKLKIGKYGGITLAYIGARNYGNLTDNKWIKYCKKIILPSEVSFGKIDFFMYNCSGGVWIDDVEIWESDVISSLNNKDKCRNLRLSETHNIKKMKTYDIATEEELKRLQATQFVKSSHALNFLYGLNQGTPLEIEDIKIEDKIDIANKKCMEAKVPKIKIKGPDILVDNKYAFFTWWWFGADVWHDKMFGFDCFTFHLQNRAPQILAKRDKDKVKVSFLPVTKSDIIKLNRICDYGLLPIVFFCENKHCMPLVKLAPDRLINSHYWLFCDEDPETRKIRRNAWKDVMQLTRNYPSFVYILHNEIYYMDYCIWNIRDFQNKMHKKYGNIDAANNIWKTKYKNFFQVVPPYSPNAITHMKNEMKNFNSEMLWLDWVKFTENHFAETIASQGDFVKKIDPSARVCAKTPAGFMMLGDKGIYPPSLAEVEDVYCTEQSTRFINQYKGEENVEEIKSMIKAVLKWDVIKDASKDKPIIADESSAFCVNKISIFQYINRKKHISVWKFKSTSTDINVDENTRDIGLKEGYNKPEYDDSEWNVITTPSVWGEKGFKDTTIAWYRKHICISKTKNVYLNASTLADKAWIYINGQLVKKTNKWNETFSINITPYIKFNTENIIAIRIVNTYKQGGFVWGGIRGYLNLTKIPYKIRLSAGQMRSHYWTALVHGCSGLGIFKYVKNWENYSREPLRILPYLKKEIETVADIVMPRPRIKGKIAILYPYDTLRFFLPKNWNEVKNNPIICDFIKYYGGCLFSAIPLDIIRGDEELSEWQKYKIIILRCASRIPSKMLATIKQYVSKGGILILDYNSLKTDDNTNETLEDTSFTGTKFGKVLNQKTLFSIDLGGEKISFYSGKSCVSNSFGVELIPSEHTKVIAQYYSGAPAVTKSKFGNGMIYTIGAELNMNDFETFITALCAKYNIYPSVKITPDIPDRLKYVESHIFEKNGKFVLYLNNWGATAAGNILLADIPHHEYVLRDCRTGKTVYSGDCSLKPVHLSIDSQSPYIFILEKKDDVNLPIKKLPYPYDSFMKRIWKDSPPHKIKVLFYTRSNGQDYRNNPLLLMPTFPFFLDAIGMETDITYKPIGKEVIIASYNGNLKSVPLKDYTILFIPSPNDMSGKFSSDTVNIIKEYVLNGGSLFVCGLNTYGIHTGNGNVSRILKPFGLSFANASIIKPDSCFEDPRFIIWKNLKPVHPILKYVNTFQSMGTTFIKLINTQLNIMPVINIEYKGKKVSVLMVGKYGKGRIVVMGESSWMWPEWLKKNDNAQLAANIFRWLAGEEIKRLDPNRIKPVIKTPF